MSNRIESKDKFITLSGRGLLGNYLQSWNKISDLNGYNGTLTIRSRKRDSPFFVPTVQRDQLDSTLIELQSRGADLEDLYVQEVPSCGRHLNFEAMRDKDYLYLLHGEPGTPLNLRHDLENNGVHLTGLSALLKLREVLGPELDQLNEIWSIYHHSIIEATMFRQPVGRFHSPLVVWEVRDY